MNSKDDVRDVVRRQYGQRALQVIQGEGKCGCGSSGEAGTLAEEVDCKFASAFIRAVKPGA